MRRPSCHRDHPDDSVFCGKCGTRCDSPVGGAFTKTIAIRARVRNEGLAAGSLKAGRRSRPIVDISQKAL